MEKYVVRCYQGQKIRSVWKEREGRWFFYVVDVLRALEGSVNAVECPGLLEEESCQNSECCAARSVWQKINDSITKAVDDIDLAQLAEESRRARAQFAEAKAAEKAADPCKGVQ